MGATRRVAAGVVLWSCGLAGCEAEPPAPAPALVTHGSLREALRDGEVGARVDVAEVMSPDLVAVGAVEGLAGEITVADGVCHVSSVRDGAVQNRTTDAVAATILFGCEVRGWQNVEVEADVPAGDVETFLARTAAARGLQPNERFAFIVEGKFEDLQLHVLNGECPIRAGRLGVEMTSPPFEKTFSNVAGRLVGIYDAEGGGVSTHHGSATHIHAVVEGMTGHVESVAIVAGATLRLPMPPRSAPR